MITKLEEEAAADAEHKAYCDKELAKEEEKEVYTKERAVMELGLEGVKKALKVLKDYYSQDKAHASADGAGAGIIGLLEVVESDFSKDLAEIISTEETAVAEYEATTKQNAVDKTNKEQDVKYKTQEAASRDKETAEYK